MEVDWKERLGVTHDLRLEKNVLLKLDEETNRRLIKAKDRSRRSKTSEAYLRLKDHLERFPDFYNSELTVPGGEQEV